MFEQNYLNSVLKKSSYFAGMEFIDKNIQDYAELYSSQEPDHLNRLNRYTHQNVLMPRMLSGHLQGRFLSMICHLLRPQYILEIGTYTGYSALCLAEGLTDNGILYSVDNNEELITIAGSYIEKTAYKDKIKLVLGNAKDEIKKLHEKIPIWDLIWIDADKSAYLEYYQLCLEKLRPGGVILADNVLWSGKVLSEAEKSKDKDTEALHQFNLFVSADDRVENVLLPIRDGIMMIRKR